MTYNFNGKTALVTGGTSGIGKATATVLAADGARVLVSGRGQERGEATVRALREAGGSAEFIQADLSNSHSTRDLATRALELSEGRIDFLVNNAAHAAGGATVEVTEEDIDLATQVNITAPTLLVAALVPAMIASGSGRVVNVTTMVASFGTPGMAVYSSTKAALQLLTKTWAAEFGPQGINVNAVSPGPIRTEGTAALGDFVDNLAKTTIVGVPGSPEDVADAITFLLADQSRHIHGVVLPVDGGRLAI